MFQSWMFCTGSVRLVEVVAGLVVLSGLVQAQLLTGLLICVWCLHVNIKRPPRRQTLYGLSLLFKRVPSKQSLFCFAENTKHSSRAELYTAAWK